MESNLPIQGCSQTNQTGGAGSTFYSELFDVEVQDLANVTDNLNYYMNNPKTFRCNRLPASLEFRPMALLSATAVPPTNGGAGTYTPQNLYTVAATKVPVVDFDLEIEFDL